MAEITKNDIKRKHLTNSMLKRVIMRADFTPMLDLEGTVSSMNKETWFKGKFENYEKRLLEISQDDDTPNDKDDLEGRTVKRFDHCTIAPEKNVILDISSKYVTLLINCDEKYDKIDNYLELFVKTLSFIKENDDYVKFTRLAIRKTDGMEFKSGEDADAVFEYFDQGIADAKHDELTNRTYTDSFVYGKEKIRVHYNRTVRIVNGRFIFILDIDTFADAEQIGDNKRPTEAELKSFFADKLNETSFELYKRGVKLEYLKSIMKKEGNG